MLGPTQNELLKGRKGRGEIEGRAKGDGGGGKKKRSLKSLRGKSDGGKNGGGGKAREAERACE